jgi:hypothetical protein
MNARYDVTTIAVAMQHAIILRVHSDALVILVTQETEHFVKVN